MLDVGCGPGTLTIDLARQVPEGEVVDASVVDEARSLAVESGVTNVSFLVGDFRDRDVGRGFDVVHAHQVLQHLRDPGGALAAMAKLCRSGGIVAARDSNYSAFMWAPANTALERWLELYLAVARQNGAEPDAGRHLLRWAHQAGLRDVTVTASCWAYADHANRAWWGDLWAERAVASSFADQAIRYGFADEEELTRLAEG